MAEPSTFRGIIEFFGEIGIYDVILPFLLIFTIVFAILEKTRVFGTDKVEGEEVTKKNINAMVAFVIGFFVVASTRLVAIINEAVANMVLLLLLSVCFLILIGSFQKEGEIFLKGGWNSFFVVLMFVGIVLIFLNALGWLEPAWRWVTHNWDSTIASSVILLLFVVGIIALVVREPGKSKKKKKEEE